MYIIAGVDSKVLSVISRLNRQSNRERRGRVKVAPDQEMLAITADTCIFFSILLKAIKAKRGSEAGRHRRGFPHCGSPTHWARTAE